MDGTQVEAVVESTRELKLAQETPDTPEALATIPSLTLEDLPRHNKPIPRVVTERAGTRLLFHEQPTNGIIYLDLGLDLHTLPPDLLPYVELFGRALLETGAADQDFVQLSQRIGRSTGGIAARPWTSSVAGSEAAAARLFLRTKVMPDKADDLMSILLDVLMHARLDNRERIQQLVLEEKSQFEASVPCAGQPLRRATPALRPQRGRLGRGADRRHRLPVVPARAGRQDRRRLERGAGGAGAGARHAGQARRDDLQRHHRRRELAPLRARACGAPASAAGRRGRDGGLARAVGPALGGAHHPRQGQLCRQGRRPAPRSAPSPTAQPRWSSTTSTPPGCGTRCACRAEPMAARARSTGTPATFNFASYRDPNLMETLDVYDQTGAFLRETEVSDAELTKSIIGVIGHVDDYKLPDAKGFTSTLRYLVDETDESLQRYRDEILSARPEDFRRLRHGARYARRREPGGGDGLARGDRRRQRQAPGAARRHQGAVTGSSPSAACKSCKQILGPLGMQRRGRDDQPGLPSAWAAGATRPCGRP